MNRHTERRMIMHSVGKKLKGSMTVELTLLMPLLLGVILFLIFSLYYLHDIVMIRKGCATALTRGIVTRDKEKAKEEMEQAMEEIRLLGKWDIDKRIEVNENRVRIRVSGRMDVREGLFLKLIKGAYTYETAENAERIDEVAYIRSHRR